MTRYKNREAMSAEIRLLRLQLEIAEKKNKALQTSSRGVAEHLQEEVNFYKEKFVQEVYHNNLLKERLENTTVTDAELNKLEATAISLKRAYILVSDENKSLKNKILHLEHKVKQLQESQSEYQTLQSTLQNTIIELETYKHDALLWSMVDSPLLREQAQKLLDKKQEEAQEIEY